MNVELDNSTDSFIWTKRFFKQRESREKENTPHGLSYNPNSGKLNLASSEFGSHVLCKVNDNFVYIYMCFDMRKVYPSKSACRN